MQDGQLRELSEESLIVEAIAGRIKVDYKIYFPGDVFEDETIPVKLREQLMHLLKE